MAPSLRAHLRRIASRGGTAGKGASKRRGDSTYYSKLAAKRKRKKPQPKPETLTQGNDVLTKED